MSDSDTTRYSLDFDPNCPTCDEPSTHRSDLGVWSCPYCGRLAIEYNDTSDGPMLEYLPSGDDPVECIKVLGEIATHNGMKAMLGTPFASKEDLFDLPQESTSRRWNPDRSAWTVDASAIQGVKEQLRDAGWPVVDLVQIHHERRQEGD